MFVHLFFFPLNFLFCFVLHISLIFFNCCYWNDNFMIYSPFCGSWWKSSKKYEKKRRVHRVDINYRFVFWFWCWRSTTKIVLFSPIFFIYIVKTILCCFYCIIKLLINLITFVEGYDLLWDQSFLLHYYRNDEERRRGGGKGTKVNSQSYASPLIVLTYLNKILCIDIFSFIFMSSFIILLLLLLH